MLDTLKLEMLLANLDASLKVHARPHFFMWSQGLLQKLLHHELLICALRHGEPLSFRADSISTLAPDATHFSEVFQRDGVAVPGLVKAWRQGRFQPVLCDASGEGPLAKGAFARELESVGATRVIAHGVHDSSGDAAALYVFASLPSTAAPDERYVTQLVVPFLHAAWVRAEVALVEENGIRPARGAAHVLTVREQEILRWIYLGKSNFEVGAILKISPLTVKNHVQKILRKLNVVNRTQAVGKALDARILTP